MDNLKKELLKGIPEFNGLSETILRRIEALGGNISQLKGRSLEEDLCSIRFDTVLYSDFYDDFEIPELETFFEDHKNVYYSDPSSFFTKVLEKYFCMTREGYSQAFWCGTLFTPLKEGSSDFQEWSDWFSNTEYVNLEEIQKRVGAGPLDFILLMENYGFPDHYYICLSDPHPENPFVFGTDHEVFFKEITTRGTLEDFLEKFLTKEDFLEIAKETIEQYLKGK